MGRISLDCAPLDDTNPAARSTGTLFDRLNGCFADKVEKTLAKGASVWTEEALDTPLLHLSSAFHQGASPVLSLVRHHRSRPRRWQDAAGSRSGLRRLRASHRLPIPWSVIYFTLNGGFWFLGVL